MGGWIDGWVGGCPRVSPHDDRSLSSRIILFGVWLRGAKSAWQQESGKEAQSKFDTVEAPRVKMGTAAGVIFVATVLEPWLGGMAAALHGE